MPDSASRRTALLVLGMHRSGTSLLSGLIANSGVNLGSQLMPAAADNPSGFWENQCLVDIHENILGLFNQSWASSAPLPANWLATPELEEFRQQLRTAVEQEFGDSELFCVKDPRLCRLLPLWQELCEELGIAIKCVLISRPLAEVSASLQLRDGMGEARTQALWLRYNLDMLAHSQTCASIRTTYQQILQSPDQLLELVGELLGMPLTLADREFADPGLRHHDSAKKPADSEPFWAGELYRQLQAADSSLPPTFAELVVPLVEQQLSLEQQLNQALVQPETLAADHLQSARENLLFGQAQEARDYAASMAQELATGRDYIATMEAELKVKEEFLQALQTGLEQKDLDLETAAAGYRADTNRLEEYNRDLLSERDIKQAELSAGKEYSASLKAEIAVKEEFLQSLQAALAQKDQDLKHTQVELGKTQVELGKTQAELGKTQLELEQELQRFVYLRRVGNYLQGNNSSND
jgi:hypothetical protein